MPSPSYETRHRCNDTLPTHRHRTPYATLVIRGEYVEISVDGPVTCRPGTIVLHPAFHAHGNRFGRSGARTVNIDLPHAWRQFEAVILTASNLRDARDVFESCPVRLHEILAEASPHEQIALPKWQRAFVAALQTSEESVTRIAWHMGVCAAHASRALRLSHGMGPQRLRRELRWRMALALLDSGSSLAEVAQRAGFSDQSHLSRVVRAYSGLTPAVLRRNIKSIQYAAETNVLESCS